MHELSLAQRMIAIMRETSAAHGGGRVVSARLLVGTLTCVDAETLRFAFEVAGRETCAEGCTLDIVRVPLRLRCRACAHVHEGEDLLIPCPACRAQGHDIIEGRELRLESLDLEEDKPPHRVPLGKETT